MILFLTLSAGRAAAQYAVKRIDLPVSMPVQLEQGVMIGLPYVPLLAIPPAMKLLVPCDMAYGVFSSFANCRLKNSKPVADHTVSQGPRSGFHPIPKRDILTSKHPLQSRCGAVFSHSYLGAIAARCRAGLTAKLLLNQRVAPNPFHIPFKPCTLTVCCTTLIGPVYRSR